jgi:peptide/nickel transport system permease protein
MHRYRFVLFRPLQFLPVLLGISIITFILVRLIPGDPARVLLGARSTPTAIANIRAQYGLDEPIWLQYFYFLQNLGKGEMGKSILYKIDVLKLILTRIEPTLTLVLASVILSILIAVPMAALAARNSGRMPDHAVRIVSTLGIGFPPFWLALMLIILFSVKLGVFPVSGYGDTMFDKAGHLILPSLTIALSLSAVLTRSLRAAMIVELSSDLATAARARGMPESIVFWRHVLPNSSGADHQSSRRQHRLADRRHSRRRNRVCHSRHGPASGARHLLAGLHGGSGRGHGVCLRDRAGQLPRRHRHGDPRSEGAAMTAAAVRMTVPWSRFLGRHMTLAIGAGILGMFLLIALAAPLIAPYDPILQNAEVRMIPPALAHPFGTDNFGRDILSRVIWGARIDLQIAVIGVVFPFLIGTTIGTVAGFFGGVVDAVFMRLVDIILAFPFLVLMLSIIAILGPGLSSFYIAMALVGWVSYARLIRAQMLVLKNSDYAVAAVSLGFSRTRIMFRHLLPNAIAGSLVFSMSDAVLVLLNGAAISYLGLGVQPPLAEWGVMVAEGQSFITTAWWITLFPGLSIVVLAFGFSLVGDGLGEWLGVRE